MRPIEARSAGVRVGGVGRRAPARSPRWRGRRSCRTARASRRGCRRSAAGASAAASRPRRRRGCSRSRRCRRRRIGRDVVDVAVPGDPGDHVRVAVQQLDHVGAEVDRRRGARVDVAARVDVVAVGVGRGAGRRDLVGHVRGQARDRVVAEEDDQLVGGGRLLELALEPVELRIVDVAVGAGPGDAALADACRGRSSAGPGPGRTSSSRRRRPRRRSRPGRSSAKPCPSACVPSRKTCLYCGLGDVAAIGVGRDQRRRVGSDVSRSTEGVGGEVGEPAGRARSPRPPSASRSRSRPARRRRWPPGCPARARRGCRRRRSSGRSSPAAANGCWARSIRPG